MLCDVVSFIPFETQLVVGISCTHSVPTSHLVQINIVESLIADQWNFNSVKIRLLV
eukprot:gene7796-5447_t